MIQPIELHVEGVQRVPSPAQKVREYIRGPKGALIPDSGTTVFHFHGIVERKRDWLLEANFHLLRDVRTLIRLLRKYRVLSLAELAHEMDSPSTSSVPKAVITFDDGFANNMLACEILTEARLPMSVFITTNAIGRENSTWTGELRLLLLYGLSSRIVAFDKVWILNNRSRRAAAFHAICRAMKKLPAADRLELMRNIREQFPLQESVRLLNTFPSMQMLSWQEIELMERAGVEIGSHGADHEIHHAAQPASVRAHELMESKAELERRLRITCRYFAYPNGGHLPTSDREAHLAGYDLAFTTRTGAVQFGSNRFLLPRVAPVLTRRTIALNCVRKRLESLFAFGDGVRSLCSTGM